MKTEEQVLNEWVSDEIVFCGDVLTVNDLQFVSQALQTIIRNDDLTITNPLSRRWWLRQLASEVGKGRVPYLSLQSQGLMNNRMCVTVEPRNLARFNGFAEIRFLIRKTIYDVMKEINASFKDEIAKCLSRTK